VRVEKNINKIEESTIDNGNDHERYRHTLEVCGLATDQIDAVAHRHYDEVRGQIDCCKCGNCCKVFRPLLTPEDIDRLAAYLKMPTRDFMRDYIAEYANGSARCFRVTPCAFLVDDSCTVYEARPAACRSYPGLHKKGFTTNLDLVFANCSVCPIAYNVYERVKKEILELLGTA
jgi:Fe-S-cluster containining protein